MADPIYTKKTSYRHQPLDDDFKQIRLLRLASYQSDSIQGKTITLTIAPYEIAQLPPYFAISYTWGDSTNKCTILINGKRFAVRHNCYQVLQQLLDGQPDLHFWIDAICINQRDAIERCHQVSLMSKIYSTASRVFVSLPSCDGDNMCFNSGASIADMEKGLRDLLRISKQEYWTRMWIVQEIVLAGDVVLMMGYLKQVELQHLFKFWGEVGTHIEMQGHEAPPKLIELYYAIYEGPFERLFAFRNWWRLHDHRSSTFEAQLGLLLENCRKQNCQDQRDKIYAILGLIQLPDNKDGSSSLSPDYLRTPLEIACQVLARYEIGQYDQQSTETPSGMFSGFVQKVVHACFDASDGYCASALRKRTDKYQQARTCGYGDVAEPEKGTEPHRRTCMVTKTVQGGKLKHHCLYEGHHRRHNFILGTDHEDVFYRIDVCNNAQVGDFLCHVDGDLHLVVRHSINRKFRIVGLAVRETIPRSWLTEDNSIRDTAQEYAEQTFTFHFDTEDLAVWGHSFNTLAAEAVLSSKASRYANVRGPDGSLKAYLSRSFTGWDFSSYATISPDSQIDESNPSSGSESDEGDIRYPARYRAHHHIRRRKR